jgi:transcriptional regulator with XRE-family HTH domain
MEIGHKLKQLRVRQNLTLEELASRCELTKGFLSQVERNLTSPSIVTLNDILEALGSSLADFFKEQKEDKVVFRKDDFFTDSKEDYTIHWIVPNSQKNEMEPILVTIEPGGSTYPDNPHEGEEFGYVTEGTITIVIDNEKHQAKKGESFYIACDKPHYLENTTNRQAKAIWISSPPSF